MQKWSKVNSMKTMKTIKLIRYSILSIFTVFLFVGCNNKQSYAPKTHTVEIIGMKFQPEELIVRKGDTVVWINKDLVSHDVTEVNKAWASPALANGDTWKKEITKNEDYFCSIHLIMKGKLIVN